jgi:CDP-glycerol glycerophosphotransferase
LKNIGNFISSENIVYDKNAITLGDSNKYTVLATSDLSEEILGKAFNIDATNIIRGAYPRNQYLLSDEPFLLDSELALIEEIVLIKKMGKKIIFYLPTFRDKMPLKFLGNHTIGEKNKFIKSISEKYVMVTKVHLGNMLIHGEDNIEELDIINLPPEFDVYTILKHTDVLITDYSSVYFDFLYLNRPIIFYPYDLEYYENEDRGLIFNYNDYTPGPKVYNLPQLESCILSGEHDYKKYSEGRYRVRNKVFSNTIEELMFSIENI